MASELKDAFLSLVRLGIGHQSTMPERIDWDAIETLAVVQGLSAVVLDGIERLPLDKRPPQELLLEWIGKVLQNESIYASQQKSARKMASLFHDNSIRTYILKGTIVSECYPKPEHRLSADIDCYLLPDKGEFDAWSLGNDLIKGNGFEVGIGFYKNSSFHLQDVMVENHLFLTPFRGNKKLKELEVVLQASLHQDKGEDRFDGTWLYRPPVMVSALFLIEHAYSHFLHEGLTWRMVLDWVLFSKKHKDEIYWNDFDAYVDEFGFRKFYDSFSRLGQFLIGEVQASSFTFQDKRMLNDIWDPLDLHESLHGAKAKLQLAGNYWRARWKYKYFTDMTWKRALYEWLSGAVFDRHPTLD